MHALRELGLHDRKGNPEFVVGGQGRIEGRHGFEILDQIANPFPDFDGDDREGGLAVLLDDLNAGHGGNLRVDSDDAG
jgi:hypothetical protein